MTSPPAASTRSSPNYIRVKAMSDRHDSQRQAGADLEEKILSAVNDFVDPPRVTGIFLAPDERRELARQISDAVQEWLSEEMPACERRRLEQLERENAELRRTIERLTARIERLEANTATPRIADKPRYKLADLLAQCAPADDDPNVTVHNSTDPLGR